MRPHAGCRGRPFTRGSIDADSNDLALAYFLDEDARGANRIVDWLDDDPEARIDIGAVELAADESYS